MAPHSNPALRSILKRSSPSPEDKDALLSTSSIIDADSASTPSTRRATHRRTVTFPEYKFVRVIPHREDPSNYFGEVQFVGLSISLREWLNSQDEEDELNVAALGTPPSPPFRPTAPLPTLLFDVQNRLSGDTDEDEDFHPLYLPSAINDDTFTLSDDESDRSLMTPSPVSEDEFGVMVKGASKAPAKFEFDVLTDADSETENAPLCSRASPRCFTRTPKFRGTPFRSSREANSACQAPPPSVAALAASDNAESSSSGSKYPSTLSLGSSPMRPSGVKPPGRAFATRFQSVPIPDVDDTEPRVTPTSTHREADTRRGTMPNYKYSVVRGGKRLPWNKNETLD